MLRNNFREARKMIRVVEGGENARTKLGSFLVFLVFLVDDSVMGWLFLAVYENGRWIRVVEWSGSDLHMPTKSSLVEWDGKGEWSMGNKQKK